MIDGRPTPRPIALATYASASGAGAAVLSVPVPRRRDQPVRRQSIPWKADDLVRWLSASALSGLLVAVGWYLAAGQARGGRQIGPLDLAIAGVVLGGVANVTWLLRGWHAVGARRKELVALLSAIHPVDQADREVPADDGRPSTLVLVAGARSRYFHRPTCPLARGRAWAPVSLAEHLRAGRAPCGVCRP